MMMQRMGRCGLEVACLRHDGRRLYEPESKERLIDACLQPGVSLAGLALEHGVNANLLRKWVARRIQLQGKVARPASGSVVLPEAPGFVRVATSSLQAAQSSGSLPTRSVEPINQPRLQATMPNGVTLSLDGCDAQMLAAMIVALGRCDVPPVA